MDNTVIELRDINNVERFIRELIECNMNPGDYPINKTGYYGIINGEFTYVESIYHLKVNVIPRTLHQNLWVEASDDLISWTKCTLLFDQGEKYTYRYQCHSSTFESFKYIRKTTQPPRDYVVEDFPYHFEYNVIDIPENIE